MSGFYWFHVLFNINNFFWFGVPVSRVEMLILCRGIVGAEPAEVQFTIIVGETADFCHLEMKLVVEAGADLLFYISLFIYTKVRSGLCG